MGEVPSGDHGEPEESVNSAQRKGAPGRLELIRQFLNSLDTESSVDQWSSPEIATSWLTEIGLLSSGVIDSDGLVRLRAFREALRDFVQFGPGAPQDSRFTLDHEASDCRVQLFVKGEDLEESRLLPVHDGIDGVIAGVAIIVFETQLTGTWPRLKVCQANTCRWSFYDHSKNGSSQWCSMSVCGNRQKARRYRERKSVKRISPISSPRRAAKT